jgi:hypothetical protein
VFVNGEHALKAYLEPLKKEVVFLQLSEEVVVAKVQEEAK